MIRKGCTFLRIIPQVYETFWQRLYNNFLEEGVIT